jgi:hypothetical protein
MALAEASLSWDMRLSFVSRAFYKKLLIKEPPAIPA